MKRVLRTLLIAVMAAMLMVLPAMAAGSPSVGVGSASAKAGESVTLDISISNNPGFVSGKVTVTYDTAALELTGLSNVMFAGDAYAPTGMANHSSVDPVTGDGVLVSATFKVKEGVADGAYNVSASISGMRDGNDALMTVNSGSGTITVSHDHSYGDWTVTNEATCTTEGSKTRTCTVEGCNVSETEVIEAKGHDFGEWTVTKEATCTEKGEETRTCTAEGCNCSETRDIPVKSHSYGSWTRTKEPNCTQAGSEQRKCSACGKKETRTVNAEGHSMTVKSDADGHWYTCSKCGHTTAKEAHAFDANGKCGCGYVNAPKLDDVPKTGDITQMIMMISMICFSVIVGAAYVFVRRRAK